MGVVAAASPKDPGVLGSDQGLPMCNYALWSFPFSFVRLSHSMSASEAGML